MRFQSIVAACVVFQLSAPAFSQQAVVPLRDEPRHVAKLENASVRIIDLLLPAGDTTLFHEHTHDIATVVLSGADLGNQVLGAEQTKAPAAAGRVAYAGYEGRPYTHRVSNIGASPFRIIGIEFLAPRRDGLAPSPPREAPYKLVLDNERVRAWRLVLEPGQSFVTNTHPLSGVRVIEHGGKLVERVQDGPEQAMDVRSGDLQWQSEGVARSLRNAGDSPIELVEFELR